MTTLCSARQNRSRILSTMGRSSGTDSRGLEEVVYGLRGADADFRRCGVGLRRRRLFAFLSATTTVVRRSVVSGVGRGMLASS